MLEADYVLIQKFDEEVGAPFLVIPAQAGIQKSSNSLDSGSRELPPARPE
ncbi:MAG: hypothetical protein HYV04_17755 [Deltaproteobacteria bacterium]|nr:hypothetical protein [Deltaproteobacteria bacterium]